MISEFKSKLIFGTTFMVVGLSIALIFSHPRTMEEQDRYEKAQVAEKAKAERDAAQHHQDRMSLEEWSRYTRALNGTTNDRVDFQRWQNGHVRSDGTYQ
jgi:hypothetical protein